MSWSKVSQFLWPLTAVILAYVTANNVQTLSSYGAGEAPALESGWTGLTGLGTLATLAVSWFQTWRKSGDFQPTRAAQIAALTTLSTTFMAAGDATGNQLVSKVAEHLKTLDDKQPEPQPKGA